MNAGDNDVDGYNEMVKTVIVLMSLLSSCLS